MDLRHRVYLEANFSGPDCGGILPEFCQNSHAIAYASLPTSNPPMKKFAFFSVNRGAEQKQRTAEVAACCTSS